MARARHRWDEDDELRPLTAHGRDQAAHLVKQLADYRVERVLSSPSVRCIETVAALAAARGLEVEIDSALGEGSGRRATKLIRELLDERTHVALCSHGDVIPEVLDALGWKVMHCAKGSTWVLDPKHATYLPAPS